MKVYLDNNIYSYVHERGNQADLRAVIQKRDWTIAASSENLMETVRLKDASLRRDRLQLLTSIVALHLQPVAFLHAQELVREVRRLRPAWLNPRPDTSRVRVWLNLSKRSWVLAKSNPDLVGLDEDMEQYVTDSENGIKVLRTGRKQTREFLRAASSAADSIRIGVNTSNGPREVEYTPDNYWRFHSMVVWHRAIFRRSPESRDYRDYAGPYLVSSVEWDDWVDFWLSGVEKDAMPRDRLTGLADYFQAGHKPTHGDAADVIHANHLLDVDLFLTADQAFYSILMAIRGYTPGCASVGLVERSAANAVREIERAAANIAP